MTELPKKITDDPYGAAILIRRLITEQGAAYWRRYLAAFVLLGVSAGAARGFLLALGPVINKGYLLKDVSGIDLLCGGAVPLFLLKGAADDRLQLVQANISNA